MDPDSEERMSHRDPRRWRLLDTGLRRAAENLALDRALLAAHQEGIGPHTLRFLRFEPCALLGYHQSAAQELNLDYVRAQGITIQRRITGGGAIYFAPEHLGWELLLDKRALGTADLATIARRICEAAAEGMRALGVNAAFRAPNEIAVAGRKLSGTGGAFDGDSILYQGTLLVDLDIEPMLHTLRLPADTHDDQAGKSLRQRLTSLRELLGVAPPLAEIRARLAQALAGAFDAALEPAAALLPRELALYRQALAEMDCEQWVSLRDRPRTEAPVRQACHRCSSGTLRAAVLLDLPARRLKQVWLNGDFPVTPPRLLADLEAVLRNLPLQQLEQAVESFFAAHEAGLVPTPGDCTAVVCKAVDGEQVPG